MLKFYDIYSCAKTHTHAHKYKKGRLWAGMKMNSINKKGDRWELINLLSYVRFINIYI